MTEILLSSRPSTYHAYDLDEGISARESITRHRESFNPDMNCRLLVLDMEAAGTVDALGLWLLRRGKSVSIYSASGNIPDLLVYPPDVDGLLTLTTLPMIKIINGRHVPEDPVFWNTLQKLFPRTVFVLTDETTETDMYDNKLHRVLVVPELSDDFTVPGR